MDILLGISLIASIITIISLALTISSLRKRLERNASDSTDLLHSEMERYRKEYESSTERLLETSRRHYERQIELLQDRLERQGEELRKRSALEFTSLADSILRREKNSLNEANLSEINSILTPLRENIDDFRKAVNDSYMKENSSREALSMKIESLTRANSEVSREARKLSDALRGNSAVQGKWGEIVLEQLLENAGLLRDIHFSTQVTEIAGTGIKDEDGKRQRPDVILFLPDNHKIVIDSKTSLSSYLRAMEAEDYSEKERHLKLHIQSLKAHVDELASKQYHKNIKGALEHTLMFIPNDGAYIAAIHSDSAISDYALKRNVAIVSPAHLLSVVQLMMQVWRVENQNQNAESIARLGGQLYDKIAAFVNDFEAIERGLQSSSKAYDRCLRHLSSGNASILRRSEKLREMGAKTTRHLPENLLMEE